MQTEAIEACGAILTGGLDVHRCAAARALGHMPARQSVELLTGALLDEDPDARADAAAALGAIADPSSADALMDSLVNDPESDVKAAALAALVAMKHRPIVPLLRKLVISRTPDIQWDEDEFYSEGWDSWLDFQLAAIRGLADFGADEAVPDIVAAMGDEMGQDVSEAGVKALACMGENGARALEQLFERSDARMRRRIASAVADAPGTQNDGLRHRMLADASPRVRQITLLGLKPGDTRLGALFDDSDDRVRASLINHSGHAFPMRLRGLVDHPEPKVRAEVFKIIAARPDLFQGEVFSKAVQAAISGEPEAAKQAALAWIALTGPEGINCLTHAMTDVEIPLEFRVGVIEAMKKAGAISVPFLLEGAGDEERKLRLASLTALAEFAADDPVWPNTAGIGLLSALNGELVLPPEVEEADDEVAGGDPAEAGDGSSSYEEQEVDDSLPLVPETASTLDAILSGGSKEAVEPVAPEDAGLSDQNGRLLELSKMRRMSKRKMSLESTVAPHLDIRRFAARLLGGVANPDVTAELVAVLADEDLELRDEALFSLAEHGRQAGLLPETVLEPLVAVLETGAADARVIATRAAGRVAGAQAEAVLHDLLSDPEDFVRVEAVRALEGRGIADDAVVACLSDGYVGVVAAAAASVARLRGAEAVNPLVEAAFANDGTFRRDIGRHLGQHAREPAIERLVEVLKDEDHRREWLVAIDALAEIFQQPEPAGELNAA